MISLFRPSAFLIAICLMALTACNEEVAVPEPQKLTRDAFGHYCNMIVVDHPGPKAQVHEKGQERALWFSSVCDGLAYLALPGEAQRVTAFYVHDMGRADSWARPQDDGIWIPATEAFYVIGSKKRGGMGALEAAPFKERAKAEAFAAEFGGKVVAYAEIPEDYILGDGNDHSPATSDHDEHHGHGS